MLRGDREREAPAAPLLSTPVTDPESKVGDPRALDDFGVIEKQRRMSEFAEEADSRSEEDRSQVDGDRVDRVEVERLADDARTGQGDGPVSGGDLGLFDGGRHAFWRRCSARSWSLPRYLTSWGVVP